MVSLTHKVNALSTQCLLTTTTTTLQTTLHSCHNIVIVIAYCLIHMETQQ